jgi:hypothetical protein
MDRRWWGLVLVTIVIVTAVLLPAWGGRRISGSAQPAPIPGSPVVGDCLDALPMRRSALDYLPPVLAGVTGPCDEANHGEVVSVVADVDVFPRTTENGMSRPESLACDPLVRDYLGWPLTETAAAAVDESTPAIQWRALNTVSSGLIGPDIRQYLAGQRWLACVAYPEFAPFPRSLRGSARGGPSANTFAACLPTSVGSIGSWMSCVQPHRTEFFGWATQPPRDADLEASCADWVRQLTGMTDPTRGGELAVDILHPTGSKSDGEVTTSAGTDRRVLCSLSVAGPRRLVGTLIGSGDQPLPWE